MSTEAAPRMNGYDPHDPQGPLLTHNRVTYNNGNMVVDADPDTSNTNPSQDWINMGNTEPTLFDVSGAGFNQAPSPADTGKTEVVDTTNVEPVIATPDTTGAEQSTNPDDGKPDAIPTKLWAEFTDEHKKESGKWSASEVNAVVNGFNQRQAIKAMAREFTADQRESFSEASNTVKHNVMTAYIDRYSKLTRPNEVPEELWDTLHLNQKEQMTGQAEDKTTNWTAAQVNAVVNRYNKNNSQQPSAEETTEQVVDTPDVAETEFQRRLTEFAAKIKADAEAAQNGAAPKPAEQEPTVVDADPEPAAETEEAAADEDNDAEATAELIPLSDVDTQPVRKDRALVKSATRIVNLANRMQNGADKFADKMSNRRTTRELGKDKIEDGKRIATKVGKAVAETSREKVVAPVKSAGEKVVGFKNRMMEKGRAAIVRKDALVTRIKSRAGKIGGGIKQGAKTGAEMARFTAVLGKEVAKRSPEATRRIATKLGGKVLELTKDTGGRLKEGGKDFGRDVAAFAVEARLKRVQKKINKLTPEQKAAKLEERAKQLRATS